MTQKISTAMILAAGRGERLRPLTDATPKPLIKVAGKHLIEYHIQRLAAAGIKKIVINTAWLGKQIHQTLGNGTRYGVTLAYSDEVEALETAGGILQALPLLEEQFIVVNGDVWCDFDFSPWTATGVKTLAHLLLVNNPTHNPTGDFALDRGQAKNSGSPVHTYSGLGIYSRDFFNGLTPGKHALAPVIRQHIEQNLVSAELHNGAWIDVGTMQRLHDLEQYLQK